MGPNMILEALEFLTTPCPAHLRRMGYLRESIGIRSRYGRHKQAWEPHLRASRDFIAGALPESGGTAAVLGAGLVYDLPLEELSRAFNKVLLVDLIHLAPAKRAARKFSNIELLRGDVTGALLGLHEGRTEIGAPDNLLPGGVDLVISANIASQLPIIPLAWLERRFGFDDDRQEDIGRALIEAHFNWLSELECPVVALFDSERTIRHKDGGETARISALYGAEPPTPHETWTWDIAPLGEEDADHSVQNQVCAYKSWPKGGWR